MASMEWPPAMLNVWAPFSRSAAQAKACLRRLAPGNEETIVHESISPI